MATQDASGITEPCTSSDEVGRTLLCQPCRVDREQQTAVGFCVNCREYLCQRCYDVHLIPSISRKYVMKLLDMEPTTESNQKGKHSCQQHKDNTIEYHCPTHSFLGCHVCFFRHQKTCKDVLYIPEVSKSAAESEDLLQINQKLATITARCNKLASKIKNNFKTINTGHRETIAALRDFKYEIVDIIDRLEKELENKADDILKEETDKLNEMSRRCETLTKDIRQCSVTMEKLQNNKRPTDLYIELIHYKEKVRGLEDQVKGIKCDKPLTEMMFDANGQVIDTLTSLLGLGKLVYEGATESLKHVNRGPIVSLKHVRVIKCRSIKDTNTCYITGIAALPGHKLIVTDWHNDNTVKLIDIKQNKIKANLRLSDEVRAMNLCKISGTIVAVTVPDNREIVILKTDPTLAVERTLKVNGRPNGIDHLDGQLVVSCFYPDKVDILDMQGTVIRTFATDSNGQALFNNPYFVAIHPGNGLIYVSNNRNSNLVCLTIDGTVVARYQDGQLTNPKEIMFDSSGMLYVCGNGPYNVHQITEECKKVKVILNSKDEPWTPCSICYQEDEGLVYMGHSDSNIKVYKAVSRPITQ